MVTWDFLKTTKCFFILYIQTFELFKKGLFRIIFYIVRLFLEVSILIRQKPVLKLSYV